MAIKDQESWWSALMSNWINIQSIIDNVYHGGERGMDTKVELTKAFNVKDHSKIHDILEQIWSDAPDKPYIHSWPGWGMLCDLCSEYWVFHGEAVTSQ